MRRFKGTMRNFLYFLHGVRWGHGLWWILTRFCLYLAFYMGIKALVLWQVPTAIFLKYQGPLLLCLGFHALLQLMKNPPQWKDSLWYADRWLGHSRGSAYWQYRKQEGLIYEYLQKDCQKALQEAHMPFKTLFLWHGKWWVIIAFLVGISVTVESLPSPSRQVLEEKIVFNKALNDVAKASSRNLKKTPFSAETSKEKKKKMKEEKIKKDLLKGLSQSYTKEEALMALGKAQSLYEMLKEEEKKENPSLEKASSQKDKRELASLLDSVKDSLEKSHQRKKTKKNQTENLLEKHLSEIADGEKGRSEKKGLSFENHRSGARGGKNSSQKDGQGGGNIAYGDDSGGNFASQKQYRGKDEVTPQGSPSKRVFVSGKGDGNFHGVLGQVDLTKTREKSIENLGSVVDFKGRKIQLSGRIPKERTPLIKAYYEKGEADEAQRNQ